MKSRTSSFRISDDPQVRLEQTSRYLKRGKNWVINRALEGYLDQVGHDALAAEARRQSLVASGVATEDEKFWRKRANLPAENNPGDFGKPRPALTGAVRPL